MGKHWHSSRRLQFWFQYLQNNNYVICLLCRFISWFSVAEVYEVSVITVYNLQRIDSDQVKLEFGVILPHSKENFDLILLKQGQSTVDPPVYVIEDGHDLRPYISHNKSQVIAMP